MPGGLVMAARAGNRMQAGQTYRTINRMERRRAMVLGATKPDEPAPALMYEPPPPYTAPARPAYVDELVQLSQLHSERVLSTEEYEAKKRQLLGI